MAKATPKMEYIPCKGNKSPILQCNGMKKESEYYVSWSPFASDGKVPFCKQCVERIFLYFYESSGNTLQSALYYTCQKLDIPFIFDVYQTINNQKIEAESADKIINGYMGRYIRELTTKYRNMKEIWTDFSATNVDLADIDSRIEGREIKKKELESFLLDWGQQESEEDYFFLEYRFDIYTSGKRLTPAQESLYRQLCLVELSKRRKEVTKDSTKEEQDMMLKLMDKLKISNFDEQKDKSEVERIIEKQIWEIENTEPCELVDKEEYKDFLDIGKNWGKHIKRAVRNLVAGTKDYPNVSKDEWD